MKSPETIRAATVTRGNGVEAVHEAVIVVLDESGNVSKSLGDPEFLTFTRSSIKPFQALALLESGAAEEFNLTDKELALCCGSHNGADDHRQAAESILSKAGASPEQLQCGSHWPGWMRLNTEYPSHGEDKDPLRNNCSGKHAGFLAVARKLGDDPADYLNPESKTQRLVRQMLSATLDVDFDGLPTGIDGCSAPNYALPLRNLALGFLRLANASGGALGRIARVMREYPEMVSGEKRFDLALAQTFPDDVVCKVGAEAIEGIGFQSSPMSLAVKVSDGGTRALHAICLEAIKQQGLLDGVDVSRLREMIRPPVKNHRGLVTGEIIPEFELGPLGESRLG
ncbi:MAG: asparaginase [Candidatus Zixiibacteriota bacterium]